MKEENRYKLTVYGLSKKEAKDMVEEVFGAVMWVKDGIELISYPTSTACATIVDTYEEY